MSEVRLNFKEMCAKFDVTPRTLRYYEYIELLSPDREGRSRFYGPRELARMILIINQQPLAQFLKLKAKLTPAQDQGHARQFARPIKA